jgi:uncharacterized integral membrane protein (TIGR00697 family)
MDQFPAREQKKIFVCLVLYITALLASNTIGIKAMPFLFGTHLSVSVFYFPLVFIMTDIVGEVYGKKIARMFVFAGFLSVVLFLGFNLLSMAMPWAPASMWAHDAYETLYSVSLRISIASVLAFVIGEYQDVLAFFFFKAKSGGKYFWLRSNLSNIWSQFLDTVIFMVVAFYGVYADDKLLLGIIAWWLYKVAMGAAFTPLSYLGIRLLRGKNVPTQETTTA